MQTSLLERLSGPLCDAVRGQHDSQAQLGWLERANLFVVPLDDERRWYRYHQLFAQVLQQRLQHSAPRLIPELHRRASRWYEQQGDVVEALSHALAASAVSVAKPLRAASKRDRTASPLPAPQHSLLVEPLTARERDVLQLLLDGASNQEIACQLTLSVNTVKKHVLNICGKLNVQRRAQVIVKARTLHLL